jgi:hypothetical protein
MRKVIKYIPVFSLWLAGLAFVSHLIVPHDHHSFETYTHQGEKCPVSNDNTGHHHGLPVHCHAFNDSASEKAVIYNLVKNTQRDDVSAIGPINAFVFDSEIFQSAVFDTNRSFPGPPLTGLSSLRAPPSVS